VPTGTHGDVGRSTSMSESKERTCFLCSKSISNLPGTSMVEVTFERDGAQHVFHRPCFVAFTTGTVRAGEIQTYRIVSNPTSTEAKPNETP
jgi:hypothetical protein